MATKVRPAERQRTPTTKKSFPWQQRLRLCVGVRPPHHVVGVVHLPLAPALRYSPLGNPEPLRTPLKLHAPAFLACAVFSLLPLLPSQAFSLFLMCWSPLPASLRAPCVVWFCLLALVLLSSLLFVASALASA